MPEVRGRHSLELFRTRIHPAVIPTAAGPINLCTTPWLCRRDLCKSPLRVQGAFVERISEYPLICFATTRRATKNCRPVAGPAVSPAGGGSADERPSSSCRLFVEPGYNAKETRRPSHLSWWRVMAASRSPRNAHKGEFENLQRTPTADSADRSSQWCALQISFVPEVAGRE